MGQNTTLYTKESVITDDGSTDREEQISNRLEEHRFEVLRAIVDQFGTDSTTMREWKEELAAESPQVIKEGHMFTLTAEGQDPLIAVLAPKAISDADPRMIVLIPDTPAYVAISGKRRGDRVDWRCPEGSYESFRIPWAHWLGRKPKGERSKKD